MDRLFMWFVVAMTFMWIGFAIGFHFSRKALSADFAATLCDPIRDRTDYAACVETAIKNVLFPKKAK